MALHFFSWKTAIEVANTHAIKTGLRYKVRRVASGLWRVSHY